MVFRELVLGTSGKGQEKIHSLFHRSFRIFRPFLILQTILHFVSQYKETHLVQGFAGGAELMYHFSAVLALLYHPLKASDLAFDAAEPDSHIVFGSRSKRLLYTPGGMIYSVYSITMWLSNH